MAASPQQPGNTARIDARTPSRALNPGKLRLLGRQASANHSDIDIDLEGVQMLDAFEIELLRQVSGWAGSRVVTLSGCGQSVKMLLDIASCSHLFRFHQA